MYSSTPRRRSWYRRNSRPADFPDATALVGIALPHYLIAREFGEEYTREEVDRKIVRGLAQLEENKGLEGQEFFERLRQRGQNLQPPRR